MRRISCYLVTAVGLLTSVAGCESGGVGDPCIPEDEYRGNFGGFDETEVNVESRSFQCETRVCLVANFKGRVSCPYGQPADEMLDANGNPQVQQGLPADQRCRKPGTSQAEGDFITVPVDPQLVARAPEDSVYCSCRCDGPDENARYCDCPSGFSCVELIDDLGLGSGQLAGSYCVREGTEDAVQNPERIPQRPCNINNRDCGPVHPTSPQRQ